MRDFDFIVSPAKLLTPEIVLFLFSSYKNNYTYHRNTSNAKNHIRF